MTDSSTAPRAPAASRRGLILSVALGLGVMAAIALDTTVVQVAPKPMRASRRFRPTPMARRNSRASATR